MDPLTLGIGAIGLAANLFFGQRASEDANKTQALEQQRFGLEKQVNDQRRQAMELSGRRQQLENFRNMQRARAQGIQAATNQGAQFGSGLQGGIADVENRGFFAAQGVNQNLAIGRNIFALDDQISDNKALQSRYKSDQATNSQWASLGGSIMSNAGTIGKIGSYGGTQLSNAFQDFKWLGGGATGFLRS